MRRKLAALLTSAALALSLLGTTAGTVAATNNGCTTGGSTQVGMFNQMWRDYGGIAQDPTDATAYIDIANSIPSDFGACNTSSGLAGTGASAWIGIEPMSNPIPDLAPTIVQIGVTHCYGLQIWASWCSGNANVPHYFAAWGGCTGLAGGVVQDLGVATTGSHSFTLQSGPVGDGRTWIGGTVDGVWKFTVYSDDARLFCWYSQNYHQMVFAGETQNYGDTLGTWQNSDYTYINTVRTSYNNNPFVSPGWGNSECQVNIDAAANRCNTLYPDSIRLWSN